MSNWAHLKVGDVVYINDTRSNYGPPAASVGTVSKITATGQIAVKVAERVRRFKPRGWEIGGGSSWSPTAYLTDRDSYELLLTGAKRAAAVRAVQELKNVTNKMGKADLLAALDKARVVVLAIPDLPTPPVSP